MVYCCCWCCFCPCCKTNCTCCKDFDDTNDIGARTCCVNYYGDCMCQPTCKTCKKIIFADPCGCALSVHNGYFNIECRNKITYSQGLLAMSLFKIVSELYIFYLNIY